uniref:MRN complex-interacting protein N-terminal domain-containing protein n=1 Tax=Monopterus albus TaxID=43700 RepID=A0A3Q3KEY8_MONAL
MNLYNNFMFVAVMIFFLLCVFALCYDYQVKKMNRWICKLCGEKQSLEFGRGPGADCRRHVQKLNAMRGTLNPPQVARDGGAGP